MYLERTDRVNWSTLKAILQSPKHYRHLLKTPRVDTDAMKLGRLTHAMVYEPETVAERHPVMPRFHGGMNDDTARDKGYDGGKQAKAEWEATSTGLDVVTADQFALATAMRDAILADPIAAPLVTGGYAEQRIEWTDPTTGIECRGRVDHLNGRLSDLKTTRVIDPRRFASQAASLHYYAQIAWYYDGCAEIGLTFQEPPAIIAVENVAPHDVLVLEFTDMDIRAGREVYRRALGALQQARLTNDWPGVSGGVVQRAEPPAWYLNGADDELVLTIGGEEAF